MKKLIATVLTMMIITATALFPAAAEAVTPEEAIANSQGISVGVFDNIR